MSTGMGTEEGTCVREAERTEATRLGYQLGWLHSWQGERSLPIAWITQCWRVPFIKTENTEGGQGGTGVGLYSGLGGGLWLSPAWEWELMMSSS